MHINNKTTPTTTPPPEGAGPIMRAHNFAARCSQPLSTNQTPHPTTKAERQHTTPSPGATPPPVSQTTGRRGDGPAVSKPNSVSGGQPRKAQRLFVACTGPAPTTGTGHRSPFHTDPADAGVGELMVLLRKEVIQPHLPVRLPCYDFVPIADPTFDRSLPDGLGHGLRVLPTFMT